jgi:hypothetical protein
MLAFEKMNTVIKKTISLIIAFVIGVSLVTSGICQGPIDQIFVGWRDSTGCIYYGCLGIWNSDTERTTGVIGMLVLSVLSGIFYLFYSIIRRVFKLGARQANS